MLWACAALAQPFGALPGYRLVQFPGSESPGSPGDVVREIGDIDGDGFADFAIGSPDSSFRGRFFVGKTYVVYGSREPIGFPLQSLAADQGGNGRAGFIIGNAVAHGFLQAGSTSGSLAPLGDVDGDGYDDFAIGDFFQASGGSGTGVLYVFYGGMRTSSSVPFPAEVDLLAVPSGVYQNRIIRHAPGDGSVLYGFQVLGIGDFNADGRPDFAVNGAPPGGTGAIRIHFGRGSRIIGEPDVILLGEKGPAVTPGSLGANGVTGGRDYNGDGVSDFQVCSGYSQLAVAGGTCYVLFGGARWTPGTTFDVGLLRAAQGGNGSLGFVVDGGPRYGLGFNDALLAETDLNHDGIVDLVYGSPRFQPSGASVDDRGRVSVLFGRPKFPFAEIDLLRLLPENGGNGSLGFVLEGRPAPPPPATDRTELGNTLARAGDVNGDGIDDLAIGTGLGHNEDGVRGRVYILFGRNAGAGATFEPLTVMTQAVLRNGFATSIDGVADFTEFGASIGALEDLNGDGRDEILVGAPNARVNGVRRGMGLLYVSQVPQGGPGFVFPVPGSSRASIWLLLLITLVLGVDALSPVLRRGQQN